MNISIHKKIYWSFSLIVSLFVFSGIITTITLNTNRKLSSRLFKVIDPSLLAMGDLNTMMLESKMYSTNWVFLRSKQTDKKLLQKLHDTDYRALKSRINTFTVNWRNRNWADSLNKVFAGFEELMLIQQGMMRSLSKLENYDDPVIKLEAERTLEEDILPLTTRLMNALQVIHAQELGLKSKENALLEKSSMRLRGFIIILAIATILAGLFLSMYMTKVIIQPIRRISHLIKDLAKGIIGKIDHKANGDEIALMVGAVNHLSGKLDAAATFAHEVGLRNFNMPFQPLSEEDTLGKALIAMRENLKTSEQELIDSNAEIQTIFNAALDAIVIIDQDGKIVKWDHKAEAIFGWKEKEIMGLSLTETIIPVRNREAHLRGMKHFLKTGEGPILGKTVEVQALKQNNEEFDISLSITPSFAKDKYHFIGFIRDITSRKKAEAKLRRSEERYRQIVETTQEGIWLIDENNKTNFVNKRMCEILGYTSAEMMGKEHADFMDEEGRKLAAKRMEKGKDGDVQAMDAKFITRDGAIVWAHLANNIVLDDDGNCIGALSMVTDITQRKLDEESIQHSDINLAIKNKELKEKNKELEQFAFVASHDLQEPLRTTSTFVGLLQDQYKGKLDEKADKYLNYIGQASDRMKVLINDLLEYSRIGNKQDIKQLDCNTIMNEVLADLDTAISESGAEINTQPLPVIHGYQTEIKQLFQNLAYNAIKFRQKHIPSRIHISARKIRDAWQFAFADNGIGIAEEHNERIFIIFQRLHTRNEYKGSGIGLSHCKKIVELHKGKIWLESELGKGTTFYFTIPQYNS